VAALETELFGSFELAWILKRVLQPILGGRTVALHIRPSHGTAHSRVRASCAVARHILQQYRLLRLEQFERVKHPNLISRGGGTYQGQQGMFRDQDTCRGVGPDGQGDECHGTPCDGRPPKIRPSRKRPVAWCCVKLGTDEDGRVQHTLDSLHATNTSHPRLVDNLVRIRALSTLWIRIILIRPHLKPPD